MTAVLVDSYENSEFLACANEMVGTGKPVSLAIFWEISPKRTDDAKALPAHSLRYSIIEGPCTHDATAMSVGVDSTSPSFAIKLKFLPRGEV